ncbi:MAG: hypothetical protein FWG68_10685 [Defluviitaleaceae bacterium]|nr:hypothetical protein [Defluviitaleaceae bacterium]
MFKKLFRIPKQTKEETRQLLLQIQENNAIIYENEIKLVKTLHAQQNIIEYLCKTLRDCDLPPHERMKISEMEKSANEQVKEIFAG